MPDLVPIRHERMAAPPRSRTSEALPRSWPPIWARAATPACTVQLCGDAHLVNFGGFASPERRSFDINDFDETLPGPFEWDVKRLGASSP